MVSDSNVYILYNAITVSMRATWYFNNWSPKLSQALSKHVI